MFLGKVVGQRANVVCFANRPTVFFVPDFQLPGRVPYINFVAYCTRIAVDHVFVSACKLSSEGIAYAAIFLTFIGWWKGMVDGWEDSWSTFKHYVNIISKASSPDMVTNAPGSFVINKRQLQDCFIRIVFVISGINTFSVLGFAQGTFDVSVSVAN